MKRIQTAVRRYFEVIADKKANELVKIYAYNCITPEEHDAVLALASRMPRHCRLRWPAQRLTHCGSRRLRETRSR
jgi:hypothetical protein